MVKNEDKNLTAQNTQGTQFHPEKQNVNWVFLGELGVLVVKHFKLVNN